MTTKLHADDLMKEEGKTPDDFEYRTVGVSELDTVTKDVERNNGVTVSTLTGLRFDGQTYKVSDRFRNSLCSRFAFSPSTFSLFDPAEVFERIKTRRNSEAIRLTTLGDVALAVSSPTKAVVTASDLQRVLGEVERPIVGFKMDDNGVATVDFSTGERDYMVAGEGFSPRFSLQVPLDGYGSPASYLSFLRQVCSNGMIAISKAFRSEFAIGKDGDDVGIPLVRNIDSYANEEGFAAITERLEAARNTTASVNEFCGLQKVVERCVPAGGDMTWIDRGMRETAGDFRDMFHVTAASHLSPNARRVLSMRCSVADLFNMATEISTHHDDILTDSRQIVGWIGTTLTSNFDLEGMGEAVEKQGNRDFYFDRQAA